MKQFFSRPLLILTVIYRCISFPVLAGETPPLPDFLPPSRIHPLPQSLADRYIPGAGDYFQTITPSRFGYLIWSDLPVRVYIQPPTGTPASGAVYQRQRAWTNAVETALKDWAVYFPLAPTTAPEESDIIITPQAPPLGAERDPATGEIRLGRARNAQTRYEFYLSEGESPRLRHRMVIDLRPGLGPDSTLATARHELGHALGLWGHSPDPNDVLYYAQTAAAPPISRRDLNTLILIYRQPTRLGWPFQDSDIR